MKVTRLGYPTPILNAGLGPNAGGRVPAGGNALTVLTSDGSNGRYWGENVRRITANGSNTILGPDVNFASGSNTIFSVGSNTLTIHSIGAGSALTVQDEGTPLSTAADTLNFVGAGVTASGAGTTKTITIPGGGGGSSTIQYGGLKPGTPLDDFAGTSLDGAWSANSSQGSFATTDCYTQAVDGSHLSMGFQAKNGRLYRAATDVDQEWLAGGVMPHGQLLEIAQEPMFGIALLNTSGTGVGIVVYDDSNAYLASITTWGYGAQTGTFSGYGHNLLQHGPYAMRITRVGNVFTGYISIDGQTWVAASATITTTFTVGYKAIGVFYNPAQAYKARLFVDWVHTV